MQEQPLLAFSDIAEVREVRVTDCNRRLEEGWVLLGVHPITTVGDMAPEGSGSQQEGMRSEVEASERHP